MSPASRDCEPTVPQPIVDRPIRVIGIDLGTTNSTVTEIVWQPGSGDRPLADVIEVEQETLTAGAAVSDVVPSVVALVDGQVSFAVQGALSKHTVNVTAA